MLRSNVFSAALAACFAFSPLLAVAGPPAEGGFTYKAVPAKDADEKEEAGEEEADKQEDAEKEGSEKKQKVKKVTAKELEAWSKQLDDKSFDKREEASRKFLEAGKPGIETLYKVAQGKSREASSRAFDVLKELFQSDKDKETKKAAKAALKKMAEGKNTRLARRATDALKPVDKKETPEQQQGQTLQIQGNFQFQFR